MSVGAVVGAAVLDEEVLDVALVVALDVRGVVVPVVVVGVSVVVGVRVVLTVVAEPDDDPQPAKAAVAASSPMVRRTVRWRRAHT